MEPRTSRPQASPPPRPASEIIREMYLDGWKPSAIAIATGLDVVTIRRMIDLETERRCVGCSA